MSSQGTGGPKGGGFATRIALVAGAVKTGALNHSATHPIWRFQILRFATACNGAHFARAVTAGTR